MGFFWFWWAIATFEIDSAAELILIVLIALLLDFLAELLHILTEPTPGVAGREGQRQYSEDQYGTRNHDHDHPDGLMVEWRLPF